MVNLRSRVLFSLASALLCTSALISQGVTPEARVNTPVDESSLTMLTGSVSLRARAKHDQGMASRSMELAHIRLALSRSARQQAALDTYLAELQDKSSPNYHKWLTPEQFGKLYGPADSDLAAIEAWLTSHGMKVDEVSAGRTDMAFSGTVTQVEQMLHTQIHSFDANGEKFFSNTSNPKIPSALSAVVKGIAHLNTIKPKPQYRLGQAGKFDPATRRMVPGKTMEADPAARADFSYRYGGANYLVVVPADAATIYNTPNTKLNANYTSGSGSEYTGAGVVIGIAGDSSITPASVVNYRSLFLGDSAAPTITNVDGVGENSDAIEAFLDTEVAGGLAPGASIHLYISTDLYGAISRAINDNAVDIFNLSFGECEADYTTAFNLIINNWWQQAAAQGIAVTVSTGDSGSAGCDAPIDNSGNYVTDAQYGLGVNGLGSTPFNVSVGGTDYYSLGNSFGTYATVPGSTNGSSAGSASTYFRTAKSYIPESTYNDSTENNGTISANVPITPVAGSTNVPNIFAASGGKSSCSTNTGTSTSLGSCTSGYSKPAWQRGTGVPADGVRDLPDVSLLAGDGFYGAYWLICSDSTLGGIKYDCTTDSKGVFHWQGVGGTSVASPAFAGILALVQQKTGGRLGQAAKELYDLYNGSHAGAIFHDVTVGNISVPCTGGSPDCATNTAGYHFEQGYDTAANYDLATGMGSTDAAQLITYWGTETGPSPAVVSVTPSATTVTTGDPFTVAVSVTGSGSLGTPTGSVTLSSGNYSSGAQKLDAAGSYTVSVAAGSLAIGSDVLTVTYSGDPTYATATKTATVQVNGLTATVTVTPSTATLSSTAPLDVAVTVSGASGSPTPTGTVTLSSGAYTSAAQQLTAGSFSFTIPANSLSAGSNTITVAYSGDGIYAPASGTSVAVTVTASTFALSATTPSAVTSGSPATSTVTVTGSDGYAGTVTLACSLTTSPTGATTLPTCSAGSSTVTLSASATSGTATMTVTTSAPAAALRPGFRKGPRWAGAGSGLLLACLVLFGIPARRRGWRSMLGCAVVMAALATLTGCGGFWDPPTSTTGTGVTAGAYTFTVTGTGSPSISLSPSTTFIVTVQ